LFFFSIESVATSGVCSSVGLTDFSFSASSWFGGSGITSSPSCLLLFLLIELRVLGRVTG
jgi:hypothetical protein